MIKVIESRNQVITTKYLPATNRRGARVSAMSAAGHKKIISYDYGMNAEENHKQVMIALCEFLDWNGTYIMAPMWDNTGFYFICTSNAKE